MTALKYFPIHFINFEIIYPKLNQKGTKKMPKVPNFAIVLSGCGVFDGSEIHEATCTILSIDEVGCKYQCFAPNMYQAKTMDHFTGKQTAASSDDDNRNVLAESARIARGDIKDLKEFKAKDFDAVIFPGGFGAAVNLSNFAEKGAECEVFAEVKRVIEEAHNEKIVIGAMCIAPVVIARVLGKKKIKITIGTDKQTALCIENMGAVHENMEKTDVCVDEKNRIVTTPCYMLCKSIREVFQGTRNLIDEALELIGGYSYDYEEDECSCGGGCSGGCHSKH